MSNSVLPGNTPLYLCQMRSDLHKTFSVCQDWSPELIINVHGHAQACMYAQCMEMCMQFRAVIKPLYLCCMKSVFFMKLGKIIKEVSRMHQKIGSDTCTHAPAKHVNVHASLCT